MKPESKVYTTTVGDKTISFETGKLAGQAGGAVTVRVGDSIIFASATMGGVREGIDFFPLSVDYEERLYATGKIPGSFFRREGRPGTEARFSPKACAMKSRSSCSQFRRIARIPSTSWRSMPHLLRS